MKFKILCNYKEHSPELEGWWESYDRAEVKNLNDAIEWGEKAVAYFNDTLRPHEKERIFIKAEITGESNLEHDWEKTNIMTIIEKHRMFDTYKCSICGITGKRFGLSPSITRDSKYMLKKYESCIKKEDE